MKYNSKEGKQKLVIKTINKKELFYLYDDIVSAIYTTRLKPLMSCFFDKSKGKIREQKLSNTLTFMIQLKVNWRSM